MSAADDQLASAHAPMLYLVQLDFTTGTQRITNWSHNLEWASQTWYGLGVVVSISGASSSERLEYPVMELGLSIAKQENLALALGNAAAYRGRPVTLFQCVLDDEFRPLGDPELAWSGLMDQVRVKTGDGEQDPGSVVMRCEQPGKDRRGPQSLRLTHAQHVARHPGDTFLSRMEQLTGQPVPWLSVKFQHRD